MVIDFPKFTLTTMVGSCPDAIGQLDYKKDLTIENVLNKIKYRADAGMIKYGVSMFSNPAGLRTWLVNTQEELLDAAAYIERTIQEIDQLMLPDQTKGKIL